MTSVPPAFIMGILSEESDLGQNVAQLQLPDRDESDQRSDLPHHHATARSRSQLRKGSRASLRMAGAVRWVLRNSFLRPGSYTKVASRPRAVRILPIPWDPRTATFRDSALYGRLGANAGTTASERQAALKYFAGGSWQNPSFAFYGNDVICLTQKMQQADQRHQRRPDQRLPIPVLTHPYKKQNDPGCPEVVELISYFENVTLRRNCRPAWP